MTALEFIHKHQNDEDNGECLILPDGSVEEPLPSHIGRLVELTGMDAGALHGRMEKNMEPLFWLVEYTGCMSVWQTRVVAPTVPTGQQQAAQLLGMTQPKLSNLLRGQFRGISEAKMLECLVRLGRDVEIVVGKEGNMSGKLKVKFG